MNIHEHQSKEMLRAFGVNAPKGKVAFTVEEAVEAANALKSDFFVVKAQIHAGGRGKAGGVKFARNLEEVRACAAELLGKTLVTPQTGPQGKRVNRLLIEEGCRVQKEYYIGLVIDRATGRATLTAFEEGGMDIEEVAASDPSKMIVETIDPAVGLLPFQARRIAAKLRVPPQTTPQMIELIDNLHNIFIAKDCLMIEINPLAMTDEGTLLALDAKMSFDDNALFRQPDVIALRDEDEEDPREARASRHQLNYIALDGNIGCVVNGAGLAMATMDMIHYFGGKPANFLDVGGGATPERVMEAFRLILSDQQAKGIFVNIFGGIIKCDAIAKGIIDAANQFKLDRPLVVRLEGTNADLGKKMLRESGLSIVAASSMDEGAKKIVSLVQ